MVVAREPTVAVVAGLSLASKATAATGATPNPARGRGSVTLTFRSALPQVIASVAAQTINIMVGVAMAYSSTLIPQLEADTSEIPVTRTQSAWLASVLVLTVPVGAVLSGVLIETVGRLNAIKLCTVPYVIAWATIATATTFTQVLLGRLLMGCSIGIATPSALLYIAEVTDKRLRGALSCMGTVLASLGILAGYVSGAYLHWRTAAWVGCAAPVIPLILMFVFAMESPVWLRSKGKLVSARKSSMYFYSDPDVVMSVPSAKADPAAQSLLHRFGLLLTQPSGYKPFFILNVLFIIQQLTGIYITIYFAVTFFQEVGSDLDAYVSTILIGAVRFACCLVCSFLMGRGSRRVLMMISAVGMAICMGVTSYATWRIQLNDDLPSWLVVAGVLMYVATGCMGFQTIPWTMMSELFPHEVRGLAQTFTMATAHLYMFAVLQMYPILSDLLGGAAGVQCCFAVVSLASALFVWIFMPETCGKSLAEIEEYFKHNIVFLGQNRKVKNNVQTQNSA